MTAHCGHGVLMGRGNWGLAALKRAPTRCKWAFQPTGQKFGLEAFKLSDCSLMAAFGFGGRLPAMPMTQINSLFQRGFHRTRIGRLPVLVISRCLPSSQMERFGVAEVRQIS